MQAGEELPFPKDHNLVTSFLAGESVAVREGDNDRLESDSLCPGVLNLHRLSIAPWQHHLPWQGKAAVT